MPKPTSSRHLDPRGPFVFDTRDLGRRPGSLRTVRAVVPAPDDLGTAVIGVPPGAEVELDLRLEAVMEGVLVTGTARAGVTGECARCLDPVARVVDVDLQQLYVYPDIRTADGAAADVDLGWLDDDRLDLEPALRDAVVLAMPLTPRCREDCPGLCPTCGARLADEPPGHAHDELDPRWAALAAVRDNEPTDPDQES